jgi:hypothetical protein
VLLAVLLVGVRLEEAEAVGLSVSQVFLGALLRLLERLGPFIILVDSLKFRLSQTETFNKQDASRRTA